jgi:hypothetical protein
LAHKYPSHVKALHTNWALAPFPSFATNPLLAVTSLIKHTFGSYFYTAREAADIKRAQAFQKGPGRVTPPGTMAYSLSDSPTGLLAFIYEKLNDWTDDYPWTDDEILTWISIYWFSEAGPGASGYIYRERAKEKKYSLKDLQAWIPQPLGFRYFPMELVSLPKGWLSGMGGGVGW